MPLLAHGEAYEHAGPDARTRLLSSPIFLRFGIQEKHGGEASITRLNSAPSPATAEEAITRAEKLFEAKRFKEAADAYAEAAARFPQTGNAQTQLRRGIALANLKRTTDAIAALNLIPSSAGETRAEALHHVALAYAQSRQWSMARQATEELRRAFADSTWTVRALVRAGELARDAKATADETYFFRTAINSYPNAIEVAQAQFELAWLAHEAKNFQDVFAPFDRASALYADRNTDNRGRAGFGLPRDFERAGKLAEAGRCISDARKIRCQLVRLSRAATARRAEPQPPPRRNRKFAATR